MGLDGGQPLPTVNDSEPVADQLTAYIHRRKAFGIAKYGTPLQAGNGRDFLIDAFQEAIDLTKYLAGMIIERDGKLPER